MLTEVAMAKEAPLALKSLRCSLRFGRWRRVSVDKSRKASGIQSTDWYADFIWESVLATD